MESMYYRDKIIINYITMKKCFIFLVLFLIPLCHLSAQNYNNVRLVEFELGMGPNIGNKYNGAKSEIGSHILAEIRLNMKESPIDAGLRFAIGSFDRKGTSSYLYDHILRHKTLTTFADYNYRKLKSVSLFGGLGIGLFFVDNEYKSTVESGPAYHSTLICRSAVLSPRIGVEFFNRVRLTAEYKLMKKEYATFGINLGFVFGGGYKK